MTRPATISDEGVRLDGAALEAAYAAREPEVLDHLRQQRVPVLIDPQSLRMTTSAFQANSRLAALPYLPGSALTPATPAAEREHFVADALRFQQKAGATAYLVPSVPLHSERHGHPAEGWAELHHDLTRRAAAANGREVDARELVTLLAPGRRALRDPQPFVQRLLDLPVSAAYVQPLTLDPTHDSVDKLARVWQFCRALDDAGLPVIVGRVGAFGLVLQALGVAAFDSGLGLAEGYSWADQVRPPAVKDDDDGKGHGGLGKRVYVEQLLTTLPAKVYQALLRVEGVRGRLVCNLACCRLAGQDQLADRRGEHYLFTRAHEVARLRAEPTRRLRLHSIHQQLLAARDLARPARRGLTNLDDPTALPRSGVPAFEHLETWLSLLARVEQLAAARSD